MADPDPREPGASDDSRTTDSGHPYTDGGAATDGSDEERSAGPDGGGNGDEDGDLTEDELRRQVEERYDFDNFGPEDMAEMSPEEWDVAFDADTWITGDELLERVEAELKTRIADRDVFAVLEYAEVDGRRSLVAYSDTDYAVVYPDGAVEGRGTVVRDIKPTVALCSMDDYEVAEPPERWQLPDPEEVPESGSELGNWMLQLLAGTQLLVGLGALVVWPIVGARDNLILLAAGLGFVFIGLVLFTMVANARLSEKFRVEEYRQRLRSIGTASEERPEFLPIDDEAFETAAERPSIGDESRPIDNDTHGP
ncbi:DUF7319 domain-containing protein [Natronoglomus mannanivorans]|uniref:DUF7319 domain-containing protein n=1 Tax=Natronoglomus mannanivorans TaxID=2979990 RepID=A0AAP3E1R5_9EURY|nr:hypothetical protein [Halobacteria archaeon AArc-xg1-1]